MHDDHCGLNYIQIKNSELTENKPYFLCVFFIRHLKTAQIETNQKQNKYVLKNIVETHCKHICKVARYKLTIHHTQTHRHTVVTQVTNTRSSSQSSFPTIVSKKWTQHIRKHKINHRKLNNIFSQKAQKKKKTNKQLKINVYKIRQACLHTIISIK